MSPRTYAIPCLLLTLLVVSTGCGKSTKEKLSYYWVGAPDVSGEIAAYMKSASNDLKKQGGEVDAEAEEVVTNLVQATGKIASRGMNNMDLTLRKDGTAEFARRTENLGLKGDLKGTWEIVKDEPDNIILRMGTADQQVEGQVVFRDVDAFWFTFDKKVEPDPAAPEEEKEKLKTKRVTILYRR